MEDLQTRLYEKARAEQDKFIDNLLQKSPQEVMGQPMKRLCVMTY